MAEAQTIANQIVTALADYLKRDKNSLELEHNLREDLGLDSMATIELVYRIEETFDLQIPDEDLPKLTTVGAVIRYVEGRVNSPAVGQGAKTAPKERRGKS